MYYYDLSRVSVLTNSKYWFVGKTPWTGPMRVREREVAKPFFCIGLVVILVGKDVFQKL